MPGIATDSREKKRKRDGDSNARPAKKAANGSTASSVKFSLLGDSGELCPVVASSPGLSIPKSVPLKAYKKQIGTAPYELLLQSSKHPRLDYEAHQDHDGPDSYLQHYVGVYDPRTGDLKLAEARHLTLRTTLRSEQLPDDEVEDVRRTNAAKKLDLTTAFGTKKAKKAVSSMSTNAIAPTREGDAAEAAMLDSIAAASADAPTRELLQNAVDEAKPRPSADTHATTPRDVYPIASLIGKAEMRLVPVQEWLDMTAKKTAVNVHSRFVAKRLRQAAEAVNSDGTDTIARERLTALRYLYVLTELYAAGKPSRGGGKRLPQREILKKRMAIDDRLLSAVMRRFADGGELTKWKLDFLLTHVCALALIVDNFYVDTCDIREDLALKDRDMLQYFRELGCVIGHPTQADLAKAKVGKDGAAQHRVAKLRLPLEFPKQRVIVQKKR